MHDSLTLIQPTRSESSLGGFKLVDPHDWTDVKEIISINEAVFDALIRRAPDLGFTPGLAESWQTSADARTWTFNLRKGVRFHNGEPFNGRAAKYSLDRMVHPPTEAGFAENTVFTQYLGGARVEALDEATVQISTVAPIADLLDILVDGYLVPPQAAAELGDRFRLTPIGTGPYRFREWVPGQRVVVEANDAYFGGPPPFKQVVWELEPEATRRIAAVRKGTADIALGLPPGTSDADTKPAAHVVAMPDSICYAYFFNCFRGPFRDPRLRQAVNLAVNKTEVIDTVLEGAGYPLSSFVTPVHPCYDPDVEVYPYDPGRAAALIKAAGHGRGLSIGIDTPTSLPAEALSLSKLIAEQLGEVGIKAELNVVEDRLEYANRVRNKRIADMCCFDSTPLSTYRVLQEKISSRHRGAWWEGYSNSEVDKLIELAGRTLDDEERLAIYRSCFQLIHADPPWLFLYHTQNIYGVADWLGDWKPRSDGSPIVQFIRGAAQEAPDER